MNRFRAWLVTGPIGRGLAFVVDFSAALRRGLHGRRSQPENGPAAIDHLGSFGMETTVTELPGSRARVEVEVPAEDVGRGVQRAARALAREMRLPGFRKGKAPPSLVIQRLGFGAVLEEAVRESLPEWYEEALLDADSARSAIPTSRSSRRLENEGEPLGFKFEIGVRPGAELGEYRGLEVGRAEPQAPEEMIDREIERIQAGFAKLEPVERAGADGDVLLIDFEGLIDGKAFEGGKADDYLLELGSGQLIEGFEDQLSGAKPGRVARGRGQLSRRLPGRAARRRGRRLHGRRQGGPRKESCPTSTTTSPPRPRSSTLSRSCGATFARN